MIEEEVICPVAADKVDRRKRLVVDPDVAADQAEKAKSFNEKVKEVIGDVQIKAELVAKVGAGDPY